MNKSGDCMKKIEYRDKKLLCDYLHIFDGYLPKMQEEWESIRNKVDGLDEFPHRIERILIAKFEDLARMYSAYKGLNISDANDIDIRKVFKYNGHWQSEISDFFRTNTDIMGISTCCYCETAYVNAYQVGNRMRSHFDLDHFFPKCKCPILSLSLFNLVPSCQICNERLKRNEILGNNSQEWLLLSPTSDQYAFEKNVKIHVLPNQKAYFCMRYQDNPDKFSIRFNTTMTTYEKVIEMFHLNERYEFHKCEALRLLDLKQEYTDTHIKMISNLLRRSANAIKEDIFHAQFINNNHRVLGKLYRDILGIH